MQLQFFCACTVSGCLLAALLLDYVGGFNIWPKQFIMARDEQEEESSVHSPLFDFRQSE